MDQMKRIFVLAVFWAIVGNRLVFGAEMDDDDVEIPGENDRIIDHDETDTPINPLYDYAKSLMNNREGNAQIGQGNDEISPRFVVEDDEYDEEDDDDESTGAITFDDDIDLVRRFQEEAAAIAKQLGDQTKFSPALLSKNEINQENKTDESESWLKCLTRRSRNYRFLIACFVLMIITIILMFVALYLRAYNARNYPRRPLEQKVLATKNDYSSLPPKYENLAFQTGSQVDVESCPPSYERIVSPNPRQSTVQKV